MNENPNARWVIFDADNTLWHVESLYNEARADLCSYVSNLSGQPVPEIEDFQQDRDKELNEIYGYSAARFARSFEDTIYKFVPHATTAQVRHVRALAEKVFAQKAELVAGGEIVLRSLRAKGFHLGLLTAGEAWVQEKRIAQFHLQGIFHAIDVVERKTEKEFLDFCQKNGIKADDCWVVGDSLRSDIDPAIKAGLRAILVPNENWKRVEAVKVDASKYSVANKLEEVLKVIGVDPVDLKPTFTPGLSCYGVFEGGGRQRSGARWRAESM
jgi:putative hydrolase of the HAD superfamily